MIPCYYTKLVLRKLTPLNLQDLYVDWILGENRFRGLRDRRLQAGIVNGWKSHHLHHGGTFQGLYECRVDTRPAPNQFFLHFVHRDADEPAVLWHNVAEIEVTPEGTVLRHGVGRSSPASTPPRIVVAPPGIIPKILELNGLDLEPSDIVDSSILPIEGNEAAEFTDYILCDKDRGVPMVIVTAGAMSIIDPPTLSRTLTGLARVVRIKDAYTVKILNDRLYRLGFEPTFAVFDGAVRIYLPKLTPQASPYLHRLWIEGRLLGMGDLQMGRTDVLAREAAQSVLRHSLPPAFFSSIARFDRQKQLETTRALLAKAALQTTGRDQAHQIDALVNRTRELEAAATKQAEQIQTLSQTNEQLEYDKMNLEDKLSEFSQEKEGLEGEVRGKQVIVAHQAQEMANLKMEARAAGITPEVRGAMLELLRGEPSIESALIALQALYPDRIVVLSTATRSAKESAGFKYAGKALELMLKLAGPYWDALTKGRGDGLAKSVFGSGYAATESETVIRNERARRLRTFTYRGRETEMLPHLKIGVKDSSAESWRLHFEWFADEQRIVIGHCGPHLNHS